MYGIKKNILDMRSTKEIQSGAATHHSQDISLPGIDQKGKELTLTSNLQQ